MRRGALQDQELVGSGALGRGPRGAPASSGPVVPVLVFPPDLVFRADQRSGPRQLLTLYNPTGAALRFRGEGWAPRARGLGAGGRTEGARRWGRSHMRVTRCPALADWNRHVHPWGRKQGGLYYPSKAVVESRNESVNQAPCTFIPQSCAQHLPNTLCLTPRDM